MAKSYELNLPVFKQGDDLNGELDGADGNVEKAFLGQAESYELAAKICRRMAAVASEMPSMTVNADTHFIGVNGDEKRLEELVKEEILSVQEWDDEDEECFDEEDS